MRRFWRIASLAVVLLFAQLALAAHGVEHAFGNNHDADESAEACVECLALSGIQGAPPPACLAPEIRTPAAFADSCAVLSAPTFARHRPFLSRAPPPLQS
jgi:hypothetical protein